ncbi:hypothetical protein C7B65_11600 [Phormidesmis priestleyi ULC007]|uniref:Uncharacterized protein n=1 Tax=Phormidesmis priestleyi ULC007 TaxID=1920490 RepID=A0A2T1DGD0_9CYAN|nr:hypothetical protein [Phormidesmis priestleyi]PSB19552.1 hypothetical protein C7B65_11600 [Phormidesmis priestleyi ULC007]PZO53008.1 MAG: hypothetical protein DCF14_05155 [Phormidesmis priestleyi]
MPEQSLNRDEFLDQAFKKDELQCILEEYKSLRAEAQARMGHRVTLLTSSTATAGVLLGLALNILNSNTTNARYSTEILLLVPLTTSLFGLLTTYHTALIYDMADYLKLLEIRVNRVYPLVMGWYASSNGSQFPKIFWIWHLPMMLITLAPSTVAVLLFFLCDPTWNAQTLVLFVIDSILLFYFVTEYLSKVWKRKTYRHETTRKWATQMHERGLLPDDRFVAYGAGLLESAPNKRKLKR